MKNVIKNYRLYLVALGLIVISVALPIALYYICKAYGNNSFPYTLVIAIFGCLYGLGIYISGDIVIIKYRRKNPEVYNQILPKDIQDKALRNRYPFIIACIITIIVFIIFYIIYKSTGSWPL